MKRQLVLLAGACLAVLLLSTVGVAAQVTRPPDYGPPAQDVRHVPAIISLADARSRVDYPVPEPAWLPPDVRLVGAFLLMPPLEVRYPNAPAAARADFAWRNRLEPVGLLYEGPGGAAFTITQASITVGVPAAISGMAGGLPRPYGLEQVAGDRVVVDGFEYVVRRGVTGRVFGTDSGSPPTKLTLITWRSAGGRLTGSQHLQLKDLQWRITGNLPEDQLVRIARSFT